MSEQFSPYQLEQAARNMIDVFENIKRTEDLENLAGYLFRVAPFFEGSFGNLMIEQFTLPDVDTEKFIFTPAQIEIMNQLLVEPKGIESEHEVRLIKRIPRDNSRE